MSPEKAESNLKKHKVAFERAATVFQDPHALSVFDDEHSSEEERWVTLGIDSHGTLLVLNHTFLNVEETACAVRIISARKATKAETQQYEARD